MSPSSLPSTLPTSSSPSHAPPSPPFLPFARAVPVAPSSPSLEPRRPATDSLPFARASPLLPFTRGGGRGGRRAAPSARAPELPQAMEAPHEPADVSSQMQPLRRNQHAPLVLEVTEQLNDLSIQGEIECEPGDCPSNSIVQQAIQISSTPRKWKYWQQVFAEAKSAVASPLKSINSLCLLLLS